MELPFWAIQPIKIIILFLVAYGNGLLVRHKEIKVNYTRKIDHFALFFLAIYFDRSSNYSNSPCLLLMGALFSISAIIVFIKPVRDRIPFVATMFLSFDRPEDRPNTLIWFFSQVIAGFLVAIPMTILFERYGLFDLLLIPILINGIGDGMAEPIGVRFGKHKYNVHALFSKKKYVRTLEGSACIFITSIVVIAVHYFCFTQIQFAFAIMIIPALMTLAEAFSPHTWDTPFLFFVGFVSLFLISGL